MNLDEIIEEPLGDDDIKFYFPNAKILKYSELNNYKTLDEIIPKDKDFFFLLYENSPNRGHWTVVSKNNKEAEYFDSYGGAPDNPLNWNNKETNKELEQDKKKLTSLFNHSNLKVIFNPIKYQEEGDDISTCGRHCVFRIKNMKEGKNLHEYYELMKKLKDTNNKTYDEIVASFIKKT